MVSNYNCKEKSLGIAIGIFVFGIILLAGTASAAVAGSVVVRGEAAQGPFEWDANKFPAFFDDTQSDAKTETLTVSNIYVNIINPGQLIYSTRPKEVSFNYPDFGKYLAIGFMTEKYFAGYTANTTPHNPTSEINGHSTIAHGHIHKVLIDENIKRTISVGGTLALKEGYVLKATDIDLKARTMLLSLLQNGIEVDHSPISAGDTYVYSRNMSGFGDLPLIMVRFDSIFSGSELQVAFLRGIFQISDNPINVKTGDKFDKMNVTNVSIDTITMNNYLDIGLSKNANIGLMGNIKFKIADNNSLRYYPFVEFTQPGKYEVRGPVFNGSIISSWNGRTFSGFYYDLNNDRSSEVLTINDLLDNDRIISREQLRYNTAKIPVDFKAYEKEGITVNGQNSYSLVGWQGEKYVAINNVGNKLARLVFEMGRDDKKTLSNGETWYLGAGYELEVNDMDVKIPIRQVWFTLKKDGVVIDEVVIMSPVCPEIYCKQNSLYTKKLTLQGETDAVLFTVYVDTVFSGATSKMVQFKYAWLIDGDSANEIRAGDRYGDLEVRMASSDMIELSNTNVINLSKNSEPELFGGLKLKVADSDQLRFYLKKDYDIPDQSAPPSAPSILINNGDVNTNSTSVTLNVSAVNALEMSFSNDNIYWSGWDAVLSTKLWKLSNKDGLKTVYFKTRNAAGETLQVSDTINLVTPKPLIYNNIEIRGTVANEQDGESVKPAWNAQSFSAFYYDHKYDRSTETLVVDETLLNLNSTRIINKDVMWYNTTKIQVDFKAYEKEGVSVNRKNSYDVVGWQGEKLVAIKGITNKLATLAFEMGTEDKKTMLLGESWKLGRGYELKVNSIDAMTVPRQVWFTLTKDGVIIDEAIAQAPGGPTIADKEKAVYFKTMTLQGEPDALIFSMYIDSIFSGTTTNLVQFKYGWLIDKDSAMTINAADRFGVFEVRTADSTSLVLSNEDIVNLSGNTELTLMGNMIFKVADSGQLRFYPAITYTQPGIYEVRGSVASALGDPSVVPSWNGMNFPVFYYDLKSNRYSETLELTEPINNISSSRTIYKETLKYNTTKIPVHFKAFDKEGVDIGGSTTYDLVGWQGQKWVSINGSSNKIARLVFEMDRDDKKTLTTGGNWDLGAGYTLTVDTIDASSIPRKVWFTLRKNGEVISTGEGQSANRTTLEGKQKAVHTTNMTIPGEQDTLLLTVYIDSIFQGATTNMVQFKYGWLIDKDSSIEIKAGDKFGVFEVRTSNPDHIKLTNERNVVLSKNTEVTLIGDLKFVVADNDALRFYPRVDRVIGWNEQQPYSMSILVNHGETYAISKSVTLSVSAVNASEMSFSNDGFTWNPWEPYSTTKSWTLTEGEGLKTVYFKSRNSEGEANMVNDTIILKSLPVFDKIEIRGTAVNEPQTPGLMPAWNAWTFAGFFYDFNSDRQTDSLNISQDLHSLNFSRIITRDVLRYDVTKVPFNFIVYQKEGVLVNGKSSYDVVGWGGEKHIAIKGVANKSTTLVLEMGKEEKKTLATGETWSLGSGYELNINAVDARTTPRLVWFTLKKNGTIIDEGIGQAPMSSTLSDKEKAVYYKTMTILGESDALLFTVYVDSIFSGAYSDMVQFKYAWLIDKDSAKEIKVGDRFDVLQVRTANPDHINLTNEDQINLTRNTEPTIIGKIKFKIADSNELRFYPFIKRTTPGTYEVRGEVALDPLSIPSWYGRSFAGMYYDLDSNIQTENLSFTKPLIDYYANREIPKDELVYDTTKASVNFKAFEKEGVLINGKKSYEVVGWQGDKYVAIKGVANKFGNLIFEMGKDDYKILTIGETWSLGRDYELTANAIDARAKPRLVWLSLKKGGQVIDEFIAQAPEDNSTPEKQKAVYIKTMTIQGESDALLFIIYVDRIFSGPNSDLAQFKYGWLFDPDSAEEIRAGDVFDSFEVREATPNNIKLTNERIVSLAKNTESILFGKISLRIADDDTLRLYPKVDYVIKGSQPNGAPAMISFSPLASTVTSSVGESVVFNITVNQTVNVSWRINETEVINEADVTTSSYTSTNTSPGTWIVNATAANARGKVSQKWTWVVRPTSMKTGRISGMIFNDMNNNSIKDAGENGLAGWTIVLTMQGGSAATRDTDANGSYTFSNLAQGNYTVAEVIKPGWKQTFPANGTYNVTITGRENLTGMDFGNNLPGMPPANVTIAARKIEKESLRPGESNNITIDISSNMSQALALHEIIPAGWNLTRISDDADTFKRNTSEWIWFNVTQGINKTVIYRLNAPVNASIGTYHLNGAISNQGGVIEVVQGDNTITFDILAFYRRLGSDTGRVETTDVLTAAQDWRNNIVPAGFERAITTQEFLSLIDEWMRN